MPCDMCTSVGRFGSGSLWPDSLSSHCGRSINYEMAIAIPQNKHNKFAIKCLNCANGLVWWSNGRRLNDHSGRRHISATLSLGVR